MGKMSESNGAESGVLRLDLLPDTFFSNLGTMSRSRLSRGESR
jgi:hypothetical protein